MMKQQPTTMPPSRSTSWLGDRLDRAAGREHVVVDQNARPVRDHVRVQLESVLSVLECVCGADRLGRQLAGPSGRNEAATDLVRDRSPEDEPARLGTDDQVGLLLCPPLRKLVDRILEGLGIREQRRDVLEPDTRLGPVRYLSNLLGEIHPIMLTQAGAARARRAV